MHMLYGLQSESTNNHMVRLGFDKLIGNGIFLFSLFTFFKTPVSNDNKIKP